LSTALNTATEIEIDAPSAPNENKDNKSSWPKRSKRSAIPHSVRILRTFKVLH